MNKKLKLPTQKYLNSILEYKDGLLYWKISKAGVKIGKKAGYINARYYMITVDKTTYQLHNVIWKMINGVDPIGNIDHINHEKLDNRIENLRDVSHKENSRNRSLYKNNSSGYNNIKIINSKKKYYVFFQIEKYFKAFMTLNEAIQCRNEKYLEFGFHENHGKNI